MIIRKVKVNRFGCLDDFEVAFGAGLNVVKGLNETGKSTLHQALLMALLERPTKKKANEDYRTWGVRRLFELEVEYESLENARWILFKDFESNTVKLLKPDLGSMTSWEEIQETLGSTLGTVSLKVFKSTVCVSQDELTAITEGQKEISHNLEEIVTGGAENIYTSDAITRLEKAIQTYRRGYTTNAPRNPGRLAQLAERQKEYQGNVAEYSAAVDGQNEAQVRLVEIAARLVEKESELEPRLATRELADNVTTLTTDLNNWREKEGALASTLDRITEAERQISESEDRLANIRPVTLLTDAEFQELTSLHERVRLLESQKDAIEKRNTSPQPPSPQRLPLTKRLLPPITLMLLGAVGCFTGVGLGMLTDVPRLPVVLGVGLCLILAIGGLIWLFAILLTNRSGHIVSGDGMPVAVLDEAQLEQARQDLENSLVRLDCVNWETFEQQRKAAKDLLAVRDSARARLEGLLPTGKTKQVLEFDRRAASLKRRDLEEKLETPGIQRVQRMSPIEYQSLCREISQLVDEQDELKGEAVRLRARLDNTRVSREDLLKAEEQLSALNQEFERAQERLAVYELTLEAMGNARDMTLVRAQDQLGPLAGGYLQVLTGGRYSEISVDSDLNVLVKSSQKSDGLIEPKRLSRGTQDQLYFALRLALVDLLFPHANPPLFLDDPFVKFDPVRKQAAIGICQQIAQRRQVLLFACSNDYDQCGHVIKMDDYVRTASVLLR